MATQLFNPDGITESCPNCGRETLHEVELALVTESSEQENAQFSREPYRLSTCVECGVETEQRMNNA
jgi:rRNA maturation protein Nop10